MTKLFIDLVLSTEEMLIAFTLLNRYILECLFPLDEELGRHVSMQCLSCWGLLTHCIIFVILVCPRDNVCFGNRLSAQYQRHMVVSRAGKRKRVLNLHPRPCMRKMVSFVSDVVYMLVFCSLQWRESWFAWARELLCIFASFLFQKHVANTWF